MLLEVLLWQKNGGNFCHTETKSDISCKVYTSQVEWLRKDKGVGQGCV